MPKQEWVDYLATKIKSQVSIENAAKAQAWAFAVLCLVTTFFAFNGIGKASGRTFIYGTKVLFLLVSHVVLAACLYLPGMLQKGEKTLSKLLSISDRTSLTLMGIAFTVFSAIHFSLSAQAIDGFSRSGASNLFGFALWANFLVSGFYFYGCIAAFLSFAFFPGLFVKVIEKGTKLPHVFFGIHLAVTFFMWMGYSEIVTIGSPRFFEQFIASGLFIVSMVSLTLLLGQWTKPSHVSALADLELEVASDKLSRKEDVLVRIKEAFMNSRLTFWLKRVSHRVASRSHEIAEHTHEAVSLVDQDKPKEMDLRKVEDHYKKAGSFYKKLDKEHQRFLLSAHFFVVNEAEREKIEELRDLFSKELRNAKLELASVRKRIDDKLVSIKDGVEPASEVPVEKVPLSN